MQQDEIDKILKKYYSMSQTDLISSTNYQYRRMLLSAVDELERKTRELWELERQVEMYAIALKVKEVD